MFSDLAECMQHVTNANEFATLLCAHPAEISLKPDTDWHFLYGPDITKRRVDAAGAVIKYGRSTQLLNDLAYNRVDHSKTVAYVEAP